MALHRSGSYLSFPVSHCSVFLLCHSPSSSVLHYHHLFFSSPTFLSISISFLSDIFFAPSDCFTSIPFPLVFLSSPLSNTLLLHDPSKFKSLATSYQTGPRFISTAFSEDFASPVLSVIDNIIPLIVAVWRFLAVPLSSHVFYISIRSFGLLVLSRWVLEKCFILHVACLDAWIWLIMRCRRPELQSRKPLYETARTIVANKRETWAKRGTFKQLEWTGCKRFSLLNLSPRERMPETDHPANVYICEGWSSPWFYINTCLISLGCKMFEFCSATWYILFSKSVYVVHYCVMTDGNEVIELDYIFLHPFSPCLHLYVLISRSPVSDLTYSK